ncbi:MAG: ABC transporter ATP-binding protein [Francisellaceae bacterium]
MSQQNVTASYKSQSRYPLFRLLSYMRPFRKDYVLALIYSTLNKLFDILPEILLGIAVNVVVERKDSWVADITGFTGIMQQLLILGLLTFVIWVLESVFQYLYSLKWRNLAQNVEHLLRVEVYDHIQRATVGEIEQTPAGQLIATINDDINQMERFLENGVNQIVQIIVSTLFIGLVFLYSSPLITLFAIAPIPLILIGAFYFQHKLEPRFLDVRQKAADISVSLTRNLLGLLTIKSYTSEAYERDRIERVSKDYQTANRHTIKISSMVTPVIRMFVLTGFLFTLLIGGYQTIYSGMNVGTFSVLIFLSQRLLWPFNYLAEVTVDYQRVMASTTRVFNLFAWQPEFGDKGVEVVDLLAKDIVFDRVTFRYISADKAIFQDFSLVIPANKTIAFVGESGSGKSTIIKLLCQFYEVDAGGIYFGGENIKDLDKKSWRQRIALVSQEPFLFDGSIRENICYGCDVAGDRQMIEAARIAGIHEFVETLPKTYDTDVGQRGVLLSGGQKQRIAIARAILKDAPILILDEATSAVDNQTEYAIQKALNTLAHHKTTVIIAHRLSTIRHADTIIVMDKGEIIEQGRHEALVARNGHYARLWRIQIGEII